jgi:hypothetical protein
LTKTKILTNKSFLSIFNFLWNYSQKKVLHKKILPQNPPRKILPKNFSQKIPPKKFRQKKNPPEKFPKFFQKTPKKFTKNPKKNSKNNNYKYHYEN